MTFGMLTKDFFFFLFILLVGFASGLHIEFTGNALDFDRKMEKYESYIDRPLQVASDDFRGQLHILIADRESKEMLKIEIPFSFIHIFSGWGNIEFSEACNELVFQVGNSNYCYAIGRGVTYGDIKSLKPGKRLAITAEDEAEGHIIYLWRTLNRRSP